MSPGKDVLNQNGKFYSLVTERRKAIILTVFVRVHRPSGKGWGGREGALPKFSVGKVSMFDEQCRITHCPSWRSLQEE